jgi:protein-tyrosine phosphatase
MSKCDPQGYKISKEDFIKANENWIAWQEDRFKNSKIWCINQSLNSWFNRNVFKYDYKVIEEIIDFFLDEGNISLMSFLIAKLEWIEIYNWRKPNYEEYNSNKRKAELIKEEFMWVDWEFLDFVEKNIEPNRYASGKMDS